MSEVLPWSTWARMQIWAVFSLSVGEIGYEVGDACVCTHVPDILGLLLQAGQLFWCYQRHCGQIVSARRMRDR